MKYPLAHEEDYQEYIQPPVGEKAFTKKTSKKVWFSLKYYSNLEILSSSPTLWYRFSAVWDNDFTGLNLDQNSGYVM